MLADWNATGSLRNTTCYILNKAKAKLIDKNIPGRSAGDLAAGMELLAQQNPSGMLRNVGHHFKLSFADDQHPTDEQLVEATRTFLQEFGIERDRPYLAAVHRDTRHTHAHILVASDGYDGKTLDGAWTKRRTKEATIRAASRLEWTSPTPNRRGLYFSFDELQQMAKMQQPTEQLARWAEENQFDLSSWNALDWQRFSQHPGVVLSQLEQQRELPTAIASAVQPSAPERQLERVSKPRASTPSESDSHSEPAALTSPSDQIAQSLIPLMNWLLHQHNLKVIRGRYWDVDYIESEGLALLVMLHKSSGWQLQAIQSDDSWQIAAVSDPPSESVVMAMRNLLEQLQDFSTAQQRSQQQQQKLRLSEQEL